MGGAAAVEQLAIDLGAPMARLVSDLDGRQVAALVTAHGAPAVRWAGTELAGQRAQALLRALSAPVLRRCRLGIQLGGVTPTQAEALVTVLGDARLQRVVGQVHMRELVPLTTQQESGAAAQMFDRWVTDGEFANMRRYLQSAERAAAVELAAAAGVGATDIIVDTNTLSTVRALIAAGGWGTIQEGERAMVVRLFDQLGQPLPPAVAAAGGTGPTRAQLEGIMPRLRAPATVLGETGIQARRRPPGGGPAVDLGPVDRPAGLDITVDRNSADYRDMLRVLTQPPPRAWTLPAQVQPSGFTAAVGGADGIRDRTIVADALFAARPGPDVPRFISADGRIVETLAAWAVPGTVVAPPAGPGPVARRFARANAGGFTIRVLGRELRVIPVGI